MTAAEDIATGEKRPGIFRCRVVAPIQTQLSQGATPRALAHAIAAGAVSGLFPLLGTTMVLGGIIGYLAKLNQPVLHTFNWLVYPLHILGIPLFVRSGEIVFRTDPVPFSLPLLIARFGADPMQFLRDFGMSGVHAIVAWLLISPFLAIIIIAFTRPILETASRRWNP